MIYQEELMRKYTKQQLLDFAKKLICLRTSLISEVEGYDEDQIDSINRQIYGQVKTMTKNEICLDCRNIFIEILNFDVKPHFTFFWNDKGSDSIKQELYDMISEKNDLVDKFIHTDYFNLFWAHEIKEYKLKLLDCELLKYFVIRPKVKGTLLSKNEIITKWKGYKSIFKKGELLGGDEAF
jgi:hypothetical protein